MSRRPPLDRFLLFLYTFLFDIPSVQPEHPLDAARRLSQKGVSIPYSLPLPAESTNWKVAFERPSDITLIGSWANELAVKGKDGSKFGVDLAIEMPQVSMDIVKAWLVDLKSYVQSLFQEKDYLNGRFFNKRAFYLATIVDAIVSSKDQLNVEVSYFSTSNDPRLTALVISPIQSKILFPLLFSSLTTQVKMDPLTIFHTSMHRSTCFLCYLPHLPSLSFAFHHLNQISVYLLHLIRRTPPRLRCTMPLSSKRSHQNHSCLQLTP